MFGDDSDPTVMTERVGFGTTFGHAHEGVCGCAERLGGLTRGNRKTRLVSERSMNATEISEERQLRADASLRKQCRYNAHDAMR